MWQKSAEDFWETSSRLKRKQGCFFFCLWAPSYEVMVNAPATVVQAWGENTQGPRASSRASCSCASHLSHFSWAFLGWSQKHPYRCPVTGTSQYPHPGKAHWPPGHCLLDVVLSPCGNPPLHTSICLWSLFSWSPFKTMTPPTQLYGGITDKSKLYILRWQSDIHVHTLWSYY